MAYEHKNSRGVTYFLNQKPSRNGKTFLFFFSKDKRDTAIDLPKDMVVFENQRTGLPMVKKKA